MKQVEIAKKNNQRKIKKEIPTDKLQPSSLRANPSSSVCTPPNPNLQQNVDFSSHQNGEFTLQQGKTIPTQQPQLQQYMVPCTPLQHPNQIVEEGNKSMMPCH